MPWPAAGGAEPGAVPGPRGRPLCGGRPAAQRMGGWPWLWRDPVGGDGSIVCPLPRSAWVGGLCCGWACGSLPTQAVAPSWLARLSMRTDVLDMCRRLKSGKRLWAAARTSPGLVNAMGSGAWRHGCSACRPTCCRLLGPAPAHLLAHTRTLTCARTHNLAPRRRTSAPSTPCWPSCTSASTCWCAPTS